MLILGLDSIRSVGARCSSCSAAQFNSLFSIISPLSISSLSWIHLVQCAVCNQPHRIADRHLCICRCLSVYRQTTHSNTMEQMTDDSERTRGRNTKPNNDGNDAHHTSSSDLQAVTSTSFHKLHPPARKLSLNHPSHLRNIQHVRIRHDATDR